MNRRGFLGMMVGGLAATAAVRAFPFRVYSFPSKISLGHMEGMHFDMIVADDLYPACSNLSVSSLQQALAIFSKRELDIALRPLFSTRYE